MREVLPELMRWWRDGRDRRRRHRRRDLPLRAPPARRLDAGRARRRGGRLGVRRLRRGRGLRARPEVVGTGEPVLQRYGVSDDDAFAVGLTCGGILDVYVEKVDQRHLPRARRDRRRRRGRPAGGGRDRRGAPGPVLDRAADGRPPRRRSVSGSHRLARAGRRGRRRRARPARGRAQPDAAPTAPTASAAARACGSSCGPSRRRRGCWCSARSTSPPPSPGWATSSATRSPSATPVRSSPRNSRFPVGRRGRREVAAQVPHRPRPRPAASTSAPCCAC